MSRARLYLDEDAMRRSLVFALRARGIDVLTAAEAEKIGRADSEHLVTASETGRVLYSFNVADFCILHQEWQEQHLSHAGIIVARQQHFTIGEELRRLTRLVATVSAQKMCNRPEFLSSWS